MTIKLFRGPKLQIYNNQEIRGKRKWGTWETTKGGDSPGTGSVEDVFGKSGGYEQWITERPSRVVDERTGNGCFAHTGCREGWPYYCRLKGPYMRHCSSANCNPAFQTRGCDESHKLRSRFLLNETKQDALFIGLPSKLKKYWKRAGIVIFSFHFKKSDKIYSAPHHWYWCFTLIFQLRIQFFVYFNGRVQILES